MASQYLVVALLSALLAACDGGSSAPQGSAAPPPPTPPPANDPPVVTITAPESGATAIVGDTVQFHGTASDTTDGTLSGDALAWVSDIDDDLGSGEILSVNTLSPGSHNVTLTATDSGGETDSDTIFLRVADPAATQPNREGERNPYGAELSRLPVKLDDELIIIGQSPVSGDMALGIIQDPVSEYEFQNPSSAPVPPAVTTTIADREPIAVAAGRIIASPFQQAALLSRTPGGVGPLLLEVVGLDEPGRDLIASHNLVVPIPVGEFAVTVADVDAFNEKPGESLNQNDEYFDEVVLAYTEPVGNELRAAIRVFSFESAEFPQHRVGPVPGVTTERFINASQPMFPASRLVLQHGDNITNREVGPHIVLAYLDTQRRIAIDVFKYTHTRDELVDPDPTTDTRALTHLLHQVISPALSVDAASFGGWDVVIENGGRLGVANPLDIKDIIIPVYHQNGQFVQDAWVLEDLDGFENPISLTGGPQSFEFARVTSPSIPDIPFEVLPNSKLRAKTGRVTSDLFNRCEAIGLIVLADTNRGPAVQSMVSFVQDVFIGNDTLGPSREGPTWWPGYADIANPIDTTELSNTFLASGGLVSLRNGLINDRGNPAGVGTEFASDCDNVNSGPFLGGMPSFYVAQPDVNELHAVTASLGSTSGRGAEVVTELGADFGNSLLMLAADADGDAAYYLNTICLGPTDGDCRRLFLGDAELHYAIENIETSNVILRTPPKHIDYLPALGGITNVSMQDDFLAEFAQTNTVSGSITRKSKTDWSIGEKVGLGIGVPTPPGTEFSPVFDMSLDFEHKTVREAFNASEVTVSLTQTTGAITDDVVWSKLQTIDFWRFPAAGGKPIDGSSDSNGFAEDAYMEIAVPGEPATLIGPGTLNDGYQPLHQVGNILSYPTFSGDVQDIGELFGLLGSYVPTDENGTRQCKPASDFDPNGCIAVINGLLERVSELLSGQEFAGGEFQSISNPIDVAEILQIGGTSYKAELEFSEQVRRGESVTNSDSIKAELDIKIPLSAESSGIPLQFGELEVQARASAAFENANISENTTGSQARIVLQVPGTIPAHRGYRIRPSFGFTPSGSLDLNYQVETEGTTASFWSDHYNGPDPALNLPFRIVRSEGGARLASNEFELNTDSTRNRMKGFFVRDGDGIDPARPDDSVGRVLDEVPFAGDPVQLEARITNLSVGTPVSNLLVEFSAREYANGQFIGDPVPIGQFMIGFMPHRGQFEDEPNGHIRSAYVVWDTSAFGPLPGASLRTWAVHVTIDPADQIPDETHELFDRFGEPLVGPTGDPVDPDLEKGQNNRGWSLVTIAPPLTPESAQVASSGKADAGVRLAAGHVSQQDRLAAKLVSPTDGDMRATRINGVVDAPIEITVGLISEALVTDHGVLRIFDGHPYDGGEVLMTRHVQGLSSDRATFENLTWWPADRGTSVLYAMYTGGGVGDPIIAPIPARIR